MKKNNPTLAPYSRRKALKKMGLAASAMALQPFNISCAKPAGKKLGLALVGLGNYATNQLAPALQKTEHCELTGIVTGTPEKEGKWQKEYGIKADHIYNYKNFDEIAGNEAIDIVYIVLPNFMHAEYTIRALEAGKHVICEKPMAMSVGECKEMIAAAKKVDRKLQIGYRLFYEPHHLELARRSRQSLNHGIRLIEAGLGFDMARPGMWRIDKKMGGGGALMDLGPYTIQAARRAAGSNPIRVQAQAFKDDPELYKDIFGTYSWQFEFGNKTICNTTVSFSSYVDRLHVARSNNYLELSPAYAANEKMILKSRNDMEEMEAAEFQQTAQMDAFSLNILNNTPVVASGEEGLLDMQIIGAIKKSIETNMPVDINY